MHQPFKAFRRALALFAGLTPFAGCMLIQPLEDAPSARTSGGEAGRGGASPRPEGGDAGAGNRAGGGSSGECRTNADCRSAGTADEPYLCRQVDGECVKLREEVCPVAFASEISNPGSIVLGAFATLSPSNPERSAIVYAHQLAMEELSGDNIGGLQGPNGMRRPLSLVICYNQDDKVDAGLEHLIGDLGIKGVLATLKPGDLRRAYEKYASEDVFFLSPASVTETVATLDDDGKVWNLLGQPSDLVPTYGALLPIVEAYVRELHSVQEDSPVKVALVTTLDAFDAELALKLDPVLRFNGKDRKGNTGDGNFKTFTAMSTAARDVKPVIDGLIEYQPDIVISAASEVMTMVNGIIKTTETDWVFGGDRPLPMWVLSPYNAGDLTYLSQVIGSLAVDTGEDLIQNRFVGVSIAGPEDNEAKFDYESRLGGRFGVVYKDTANYYDATYFLAYAIYAGGTTAAISGSTIATGMRRLLSGKPTAIGPSNILDVFDALDEPKAVLQLQSTLGPPTFDAESGVRQVDGSVFCFERSGKQASPVMDRARFDRTQSKIVKLPGFCSSGLIP